MLFIIYPLILGLIIGYISGGNLKRLVQKHLYWKWAAVSAILVQIFIFSPFLKSFPEAIRVVLHYASYVLLLVFILRNIKAPGIALIGAGVFANALVTFLNGGYMPTLPENLKNTPITKYAEVISQVRAVGNSSAVTGQALLPWLGDIFYIPAWVPFSEALSIGDILIGIGIFTYLLINMRFSGKSKKPVYYINNLRKP